MAGGGRVNFAKRIIGGFVFAKLALRRRAKIKGRKRALRMFFLRPLGALKSPFALVEKKLFSLESSR
jgi:hypothetical protein